jgi:DNA repair protein RecN (Recombination protein N)
MIRCLHVANLAIIKDATLELGPGLNLLTGETGAGKSILVDALLVALGARAGGDIVRTGGERCSVEIQIDLAGNPAALGLLEERGYAVSGGSIVVRREIAAEGRSRAFIGDALAPLADLRALSSLAVAVHGQHQHQALHDPPRQRELLDRRAGLARDLAAMQEAAGDLAAAAARLASLRDGAQRLAQRVDMLSYMLREIDAAAVRPGERQALRAEREVLRNAEGVLRHCRAAVEALYGGEGSALARLTEGVRAAREVARFAPGLADDLGRAESARSEIEELAFGLRDFAERLNPDPQRLQAADDRLQMIETLLRRHVPGGDEEALARHRETLAGELRQLTDGSDSVADLERRVEGLRQKAAALAQGLSARRRAAAGDLERRVEAELEDLAMAGTRFAVDLRARPGPGSGVWIEGEEVAVDGSGCDVVEFLLSANRGEALRPLAAVASGGELSRLMLALEVVLLTSAAPRSLVFDEVDAGIGGSAAEALGRKLQALAATHQVLCVTHLAPIASRADRHLKVAKRAVRGRTEVAIETLQGEARVRELARMMAGEAVTPSALRHAAEMLARAAGSLPRTAS